MFLFLKMVKILISKHIGYSAPSPKSTGLIRFDFPAYSQV